MTADQLALEDVAPVLAPPQGRSMNSDEQRADRWARLEAARTAPRREFTITCVKLSDHEHRGRRYWTARVTSSGVTVNVDRMYGSWQAIEGHARREVRREVAQELQRRVRQAERRQA